MEPRTTPFSGTAKRALRTPFVRAGTGGCRRWVRAVLLPAVLLSAIAPCLFPAPAGAVTAPSLNGRIRVDGISSDFTPDEALFGINTERNPPVPEESDVDSRWQDNDISQIHFTWDADSVYLAADGVINGNNMIVMVDVGDPNPGILAERGVAFNGLTQMTELNSWRRNFVFGNSFFPDFLLATWDGNTTPRLLTVTGANQVVDEVPTAGVSSFRTAASFQGTLAGRSMEMSLPWWKFLGYSTSTGLERRYVPALSDTVSVLPEGVRRVLIAGVITAGGDGTGGPDSAPDNLQGHETDSGVQVTVDNYIILDLDAVDNTSGADGPDGLPDFGIEPRSRVGFFVRPPVTSLRFEFSDFRFSRPSFAPEMGHEVTFRFSLTPPVPPEESFRRVELSAGVFDARGNLVRKLYTDDRRPADDPLSPLDRWDGRDSNGHIVDGGIYILRLVLEPDQTRLTRALAVVR